MSSDEIIVE